MTERPETRIDGQPRPKGTVYFIGAGPGDPDLITVRGRSLIERCPVCVFAGSLVPRAVVAFAPAGLNQSIILTRAAGNTGLPGNENLAAFAAHKTGLCLFLAAAQVPEVVEALAPHYGLDAPVVVAHRVSWPDQQIYRCTLAEL